jgi:ElaB/YqjD/DUF883 family membrane-anchored ribosome-binding protein
MATQDPNFGDTPSAPGTDVGAGSTTAGNFGQEARDTVQNFGEHAMDTAHNLGEQAKDAAQNLGTQAKSALEDLHGKAHEAAGDLREQAMKYKDQALGQARSAAEEGKTKAADTIHGVAGDLRQAAGTLSKNQTIAHVGRYATQAADALENFAGTLRHKDVDQLATEVSGFVRRNPALAVGIAVAVGFALTQLLRGSSTSGGAGDYDDGRYAR